MPANPSVEFKKVEQQLALAKRPEEKIFLLEKLISLAPKHKGAEKLRASLRARLAKLKRELERKQKRKVGKRIAFTKTGDALVCLIGLTNSGKSSLLASLTEAKPKISEIPFTTTEPEQGMLDYDGCKIQIVELPAIKEKFNSIYLSILHQADLIVIVATSNEEIEKVLDFLDRFSVEKEILIVHSKCDLLVKVPAKAEISVSSLKKENIEELKKKIFEKLKLIRVYTKEPGKKPEKEPVILKKGSTIKDLALEIHKDFIKKFSYAIVFGKSVKFQGQRCGLDHTLEDKDIVEIHLRK